MFVANTDYTGASRMSHRDTWKEPRRDVWKSLSLCCGLALSVFAARAEAPPPPREFWDYLLEFGDERGEVLDPSDLAVVSKLPASPRNDSARDESPNDLQEKLTAEPAATGETRP